MSSICYADHVNHLCVDDDDDHRILIMRCGMRVGFTPAKNRQASPFGNHITCLECVSYDQNVEWIQCAYCSAWLKFEDSFSPGNDVICGRCNATVLPNDPRTQHLLE